MTADRVIMLLLLAGLALDALVLVWLTDAMRHLRRAEKILDEVDLLVRCRVVPVVTSASWVHTGEKEG